MLFTDNSRGKNFAKDPAVVKLKDGYFLYYTIPPQKAGMEGFGIGVAKSADMEQWETVGYIEPEGEAEKNGICAPGAIVLGGILHLFYQTYGNAERDAICHAVSYDGINFVRDSTNPIYSPGKSWCCGRAIDADVTVFGGRLYLYIATRDKAYERQMLGVASAALGSDFSRGCWREEKAGAILAPELDWEKTCIEAPAAITLGGSVYMFYAGAYNCSPQMIGCAVSDDAVNFKRLYSRPVLTNGAPGEWNSLESGHPYIFENDDGKIYLFYQGADDEKQWRISRREVKIEGGRVQII